MIDFSQLRCRYHRGDYGPELIFEDENGDSTYILRHIDSDLTRPEPEISHDVAQEVARRWGDSSAAYISWVSTTGHDWHGNQHRDENCRRCGQVKDAKYTENVYGARVEDGREWIRLDPETLKPLPQQLGPNRGKIPKWCAICGSTTSDHDGNAHDEAEAASSQNPEVGRTE